MAIEFNVHTSAPTFEGFRDRARRAEELGFDGIFIADSHMLVPDSFQLIGATAREVPRIRFGTAVANVVFRDPTLLASSAATANVLSGGRFTLGLGTGDGTTYRLGRKPTRLADLEEAIRAMRALMGGGTIDSPVGPLGLTFPDAGAVPIYVSMEGPKGLRTAGRIADGVILGSGFDLEVLKWARERIAEGADEVGRDPGEVELMAAGMMFVSDDGDAARQRVRPRLANRIHHNFRKTIETLPASERPGIREFMDEFDPSKPIDQRSRPELISDYLVHRFSIAGTPDECRARVEELQQAGISRLLLTPPSRDFDEVAEAWSREVIEHFNGPR